MLANVLEWLQARGKSLRWCCFRRMSHVLAKELLGSKFMFHTSLLSVSFRVRSLNINALKSSASQLHVCKTR